MSCSSMKYTVETDGAARGNGKGAAGAGVVVKLGGRIITKVSKPLGASGITNNEAEYSAVILALEAVKELTQDSGDLSIDVKVVSDSLLLVKQLNGEYRVKAENLKPFFDKVKRLADCFNRVEFVHVYREDNALADSLANEGADRAG